MADAPIGPRGSAVAVWTGSEMIVWAGVDHFTDACAVRPDTDEQFCGDPAIFDGAAYDPATDTWRRIADGPVPADGAPTRTLPVGVWTGTELVVWGGYGEPIAAAYDPVEDRWRDLPPGPLSARELPAIAVLGDEVVVLGGRGVFGERRSHLDAAALDPLTGRWRRLPDLPDSGSAEPGLADAVVDAGRLIVLAGSRNDAYVLEPGSRAWRHLGAPDLPEYTAASLGVAGRHWLVSQCGPERRAAALDLGSFHWEPVAEPPTPCGAAVPLGSQLALVGAPPWRAATWDPGTGQFGALAAPAGPNRCGGTLVSTGTRLLSWSGFPCEETGIYLEADAVAGGSRFDPR